jgi:hypothetical protein
MNRAALIRLSAQWHRTMAWSGGIVLLLFVLSGATHILMTWTGPQQTQFFAPQLQLPAGYAANASAILRQYHIDTARTVRIVAAENGPALQVGNSDITGSGADSKRYFNLETLREIPDYDKAQAVWLARYYTGLTTASVASLTLQTQFDNAYPWVNRLLPVYRVEFAGGDHLTAYIHTETASLASLTNDYKTTLQAVFGIVHTWNFLDKVELLRVVLITVALTTCIMLLCCGLALIIAIKKRRSANTQRRWHRRVAMVLWLPLLLFISSGLYHLYQNALGENSRGLRATPDLALGADNLGSMQTLLANYENRIANAISLVRGPDQRLYYRIAFAPAAKAVTREQRFVGQPQQLDGNFINAISGENSSLTDAELSQYYAARFFGINEASLAAGKKISQFDMDYDFRNKRLPVWQFTNNGTVVFIDPASSTIVDVVTPALRYEGWSFSILHKWNVLVPLLGRGGRDALLTTVLTLILLLGFLGIYIASRRKST